jgi:hypothetical protein
MEKIKHFCSKYEQYTLDLINRFNMANHTKWTTNDFWQEFNVQLGHYAFVQSSFADKQSISEPFRNLNNIKDEYADLLLQVFSFMLASEIKIDWSNHAIGFGKIQPTEGMQILIILSGQVNDCLLRLSGKKERLCGFEKDKIFLEERIYMIISLLFVLSKSHSIDIVAEYEKMLQDANLSLDRRTG